MQTSSKVAALACALTLGGMLSVATPTASAQAGETQSPSAKIKVSTWRKIRNYFGAMSAESVPHNRVYRDPSTGRTDLPASSRPWVPPNR